MGITSQGGSSAPAKKQSAKDEELQKRKEAEAAAEQKAKAKEAKRAAKKLEREAAKAARKEQRKNRKPFRAEDAPLVDNADHYDPQTMLPPKRSDFKNEADFYEWKAKNAQKVAQAHLERAEEARTMGSTTERSRLKKLKKLTSELEELKATLKAEGVDYEAFVASMKE